jgi:hypothetical protein
MENANIQIHPLQIGNKQMTKAESGKMEMNIQKYVDDKVEDIRRAVDKAEASNNARLAGMNEFRESLKDAQAKYLTRDEYFTAHHGLCVKLDELQSLADINRGKASMTSVYVAWVLAGLSLLVSVIKLLK